MFKTKMSRFYLALLTSAAIVVAVPAQGNVISNYTTIFDSDWTTAGTGGLRDGAGTIIVSGVSGAVTQSFLYWQGPTNSSDPSTIANVQVGGNPVTGTNIGLSDDNFWGYDNGQAYRADTTTVINGNGTYILSDFNKPLATSNGAGTALFFNDGNSSNNRDVVIFNGNDSNFASPYDPAGWNLTLNGINYTNGQVFLRLFVSDGQNFSSNDDGTMSINGTSIASGGIFQGDSLPGESVFNGNLFDIKSYDITSLLLPGINNLNLILEDGFNDALSVIAAFIDLPAGAAPPVTTPVTVSEPASFSLLCLCIGLASLMKQCRPTSRQMHLNRFTAQP